MTIPVHLQPRPITEDVLGPEQEPVLGSGYEIRDDVSGLPYDDHDPTLAQQGVFVTDVVGLDSFGNALRSPVFDPGRPVELVQEPDGRVGVWDRERLLQVGWLPPDAAGTVGTTISAGHPVFATTYWEWRRHDGRRVGLRIVVSPERLRLAGQPVPATAAAVAPADEEHGPHWGVILGVLAAIVAAILLVLFFANRGDDEPEETTTTTTEETTTTTTTTTATTTSTTAAATTTAPPNPGIGDAAADGDFVFVVTRVDCSQTELGSGSDSETASGRFCVATTSVTNTGSGANALPITAQRMIMADDKAFDGDQAAAEAANPASVLGDIAPGDTVVIDIPWDVPTDVDPAQVELHDSRFSSGVTIDVS